MRLIFLWLFALIGWCNAANAATVLGAEQAQYPIQSADVAMLRDSTGTLAVEDMDSPKWAAQFKAVNGSPSLGYTRDVIWLRMRIQRQEDAPSTWLLEITNPFINDLRLYSHTPAGYQAEQAGDQFAFAQRQLRFHHPVFALDFPDAGVQTFYLRMDSDSSLAAEFLVWQPEALREAAQREVFLYGAVIGMISMSFLISIIHWLHSGEKKLLQFAVLSFTALLLVATGQGLMAQFLTPTLPGIADLAVPWALALTTASVGVVFGNALAIHTDFPRVARILKLACGLALLAPLSRVLSMYNVWGGPMLQVLFMGILCTTGWMSWRRWRTHMPGAGYFFAAHLVLISSLLIGRLMLLGLLPTNTLTYMSWIPSLLAFIFLVHAGIFVDSQTVKRERDVAFVAVKTANEVLASERKLREEQTVFFSFVAHELRSPLAAIITGVQNLQDELSHVQFSALARIKRIKSAAERMGGLIERHLNLQRLNDASFLPYLSNADPRLCAEDGLRRVAAIFPEREFLHDFSADLPRVVSVDQELLMMGLENLLINAAKYSPEGSPVLLEVFADSALHFRISDRGPGIHPSQKSRPFSVFNRPQQAPLKEGFGIGLAIAQRVAVVHAGSLQYADRAGGGAVFTLAFPLNPKPSL